MYINDYETRYGDYKDFKTVKISCLLDLAQDVAIKHSDSCGFSISKLKEMNLAWLIQGINLHINTPVKTDYKITAKTGIKNMKGVTSERCCQFFQNGTEVAKVITNWFLFDTKNNKPCRIPDEIVSAYETENYDEEFFAFKKPLLFDFDKIRVIAVGNRDIDTNNHLNNQKAAEILMDALPFDFDFCDISLHYKKSAYLGDSLQLCRRKIDSGYFVCLCNNENELCVVATFTK